MSLDSGNLLALKPGNGDLLLCKSSGYREMKHQENEEEFFHNDSFLW